MNAAEARKKRGGSTLLERVKSDPAHAARIDQLVAAASLERLVEAIMEREHVNAAELARRINAKPPQVSRDLRGGLSRATVSRLSTIAHALGYDFVPALVPRSDESKRRRFFDAYHAMLPEVSPKEVMRKHKSTTAKAHTTKTQRPQAKRSVA
jgi:transcriptional regulator with XRE-family HTH domain